MATEAKVNTIEKDELLGKMTGGGRVQIVNVLRPEAYDMGMIKGSKKIPLAELEDRAGELDKKVEVVTYCASRHCNASRAAAELLGEMGFNVRAYEGGIEEWRESGLPLG